MITDQSNPGRLQARLELNKIDSGIDKMNVGKTVSSVVLASMMMYGCGGGGGGGTPSPNGIYSGSITGGQEAGGYNGGEKAIIYEGRVIVFSAPGNIQQIFDGNLTVSGTNLSGQMNLFSNFATGVRGVLSVSGGFVTDQSTTLDFTDTDSSPIPDGTINLVEDTTAFQHGSALTTINASWSATHSDTAVTNLTIDAQGAVTGFDNQGCTITGIIVPVDTSINVYDIDMVYQGCTGLASANGTYAGLGWTEGSSDEYFNVSYSDSNFSRAMVLVRM